MKTRLSNKYTNPGYIMQHYPSKTKQEPADITQWLTPKILSSSITNQSPVPSTQSNTSSLQIDRFSSGFSSRTTTPHLRTVSQSVQYSCPLGIHTDQCALTPVASTHDHNAQFQVVISKRRTYNSLVYAVPRHQLRYKKYRVYSRRGSQQAIVNGKLSRGLQLHPSMSPTFRMVHNIKIGL